MNGHNRPPYIDLAVADVPISNADKRAVLEESWATAHQFVFPSRCVRFIIICTINAVLLLDAAAREL